MATPSGEKRAARRVRAAGMVEVERDAQRLPESFLRLT
jgi:hypothetical protein